MHRYTELTKANNTPTDLESYFKSYISNQYNTVAQISTNVGGKNGTAGTFSNQSQAAAISALLGGMILIPDARPAAGPHGNSSSEPSGFIPTGAIAGGVVGGDLAIGFIIGGFWFYVYKRCWDERPSETEVVATPFDLETTTEKAQRSGIPKLITRGGPTGLIPLVELFVTRDPANDNTDASSSTMHARG
ncbi:hypothetical protein V5O48_016820 [Marasmius crinis-equi]|uniref:Uncharacterized protein n=1 Tax=Marasmius crinis-equi TaxID=585013 RepID=A0ABR3EQP0_9AGAR